MSLRLVNFRAIATFFSSCALLLAMQAQGQTFHSDQSKLQWVLSGYDPRLDFEVIASCITSDIQEVSLRVKNVTQRELVYDVTVIIQGNDGSTKSLPRKSGIKPGQVIGGNPWMDGAGFTFNCERKDYGKTTKGGNCKSYIAGVTLRINSIRDLTQEREEKAREAEHEKAREAERKKVASENTRKDEAVRQASTQSQPQSGSTAQASVETTGQNADEFWGDDDEMDEAALRQQQAQETLARIEQHEHDRNMRIQEDHRRVDQAVGYTQNMISGQMQLRQAEKAFEANNSLSGDYQSVEELMADFDRRMANVDRMVSNMQEQHQQNVSNQADAYWSGNSSTDVALNQSAKVLGAVAGSIHAKKQEREAREQLERERAAHMRRLEAEREAARRRMLDEMRDDLFERFKEGGLPVLATPLEQREIYYFLYAYDPAQKLLIISNVFAIGKYSDGTWPFKTTIAGDINPLTPYREVLHGYYTSRQDAESRRQGMINVFQKTEGVVKTVAYRGRPASLQIANNFWPSDKTATTASDDALALYLLAEQYYNAGQYETCIKNLKKSAEKLGGINSSILYLKLMAEREMPRQSMEYYKRLMRTLEAFEQAPDVALFHEVKYQEVMDLKFLLPTEREQFVQAEKERLQKEAAFKAYTRDNWPMGVSLNELKRMHPDFFHKTTTHNVNGETAVATSNRDLLLYGDVTGVYVDNNNIVYGWYGQEFTYLDEDASFSKGAKAISSILATFNDRFGFTPREEEKDESGKGYSGKCKTYTWEKQGKTVTLEYRYQRLNKTYATSAHIHVKDKNPREDGQKVQAKQSSPYGSATSESTAVESVSREPQIKTPVSDVAFKEFGREGWSLGVSVKEAKKLQPAFFKKVITSNNDEGGMDYLSLNRKLLSINIRVMAALVANDRIYGWRAREFVAQDDAQYSKGRNFEKTLVAQYQDRFGFDPRVTTREQQTPLLEKIVTYTWELDGREVAIEMHFQNFQTVQISVCLLILTDKNLLK